MAIHYQYKNMIKVNLISSSASSGRGVGFYETHLREALTKLADIKLTTSSPDLIHYPYFDLFYPTLPYFKNKPTIVTIHDLTPLVLPNLYPKGILGSLNLLRQRLSLSNVSAIITDSNNSKQDIINLFSIPSEKIHVTPLAISPLFKKTPPNKTLHKIKTKYKLPDKFVLSVAGGPNPNKNLPALAEATKQLNLPLVLVGKGLIQDLAAKVHPELRDLQKLKTYTHIIYLGYVPTPDLSAIYRLTTLYCQASLYEGFGLPLLEAMTSNCLVVSSNTSSLPEIYPSSTITFNPNSLTEVTAAIKQALDLPSLKRKALIKEANQKASQFNWSKTADLTVKVYNRVLKR